MPAEDKKTDGEVTVKPDEKPVKVTFLKSWGIYNKDETAAFPAERADWMVSVKIAVKA